MPVPPSPPIPVSVTDLSAQQLGDGVQLAFTLPTKTVKGERLSEEPSVEVLRGELKPDGSVDPKSFRSIHTVPGSLITAYENEGQVQLVVPIASQEVRDMHGSLAFRVRTKISARKPSPDSNTVTVRLVPVPEPIGDLRASLTEHAIELRWSVPLKTAAGDPVTGVSEYRVYRGELDPSSDEAASKDLTQAKWRFPLAFVSSSPANSYDDSAFEFGKAYAYIVRSVIAAGGKSVESANSTPVIIKPRDIFPPSAPQGLTAAVITNASSALEVDLSWSMNSETDLGGYRVYRSEEQGTRGDLLTQEILLSPAYRDTSVQRGRRYWYTVTAVDRNGNESASSDSVVAEVAQPSS